MTRNNRVPNYGSAPPAAASSSSSSSSSSASCSANSTTVSTKSAQNHKPERPPSFKEPRTQHNYDERRRFATAFLCWLVGGFFGAHHFYLRGWKQRFSWIYSVTSFLSLMTSVLLYTLSFNPFATLGVDPSSELFLKWLVYCAPVVTPALRWIIDVSRIPRMVQRANAPASLLSVLAPLNTADAYSMSFSGIVFGAHWLYLRPFPGNTWNSDWTEAPSPTTVCWKRGLLYFFLLQVTFGGCGIWWLYDLFRMPVHVDALLGRRRNEKHKYQPSALLLVVLGSWCGLHNFYLFGWRSRYAKLYGISSLTSTGIIGLYLSTVKILDKGFCASTFHPYHNSTSTSNNASHVMHEVMHAQGTYTEDYYSSSSTSNPMAAPATWYVEGVCWSWRIFFWLQIIAMCLRLLVDLIRVGVLGLHSNLNSDLHDREDTLARQVTYVNTYMLCLPAGIIGTHRIFLNGMTSITLIYIVTAGMLGLGWIYDLLDVPRLIDDQFSEARRVLFHAVPTAPNEQQHEQHGQHGQQGQQGQHNEQQQRRRSAIASSFSQRKSYHGPSPYGPAQPPASWRDHLVDGLAQTLQEESNGAPRSRESFNATSLSSSNTYTRGVGEKKEEAVIEKESMYGSSLKGSIAGRRNEQDDAVALDVKASSSLIIVSAEGEDQQQDGTMDPSLRTPLRGGSSNQNRERSTSPPNMVLPAGATTAVSTVVPTTSSTVLSTASTASTAPTAPTAPTASTASSTTSLAPQSSPASAVSSTVSFSSTSSISSPQKTPTLPLSKTSTPQRIIRGESSDNVATSLPPPSTPIHRIVRVHSVKHIHSPTCHPMSESLKASSSFKMIGNHNALKNGRASPNDSRYSRSSSRRQSRVSDVDLNFLTRDDIDRLESAQYMQKGMDGHFNSSSGGNGSSNNNIGEGTKKLSSIWLIEFELIQLGKKIAAGGSGQLFEARYVGTDVAVKELFTALIDSENIEDFKREVRNDSQCRDGPSDGVVVDVFDVFDVFDVLLLIFFI